MPPIRHAAGQTALPGMEDTGECQHGPQIACLPCDSGPCPQCGQVSFWHRSINAWVHADGTGEATCWRSAR